VRSWPGGSARSTSRWPSWACSSASSGRCWTACRRAIPARERCGKGCSCETHLDLALAGAAEAPGPWGCTLDRGELVTRIGQWRALAAAATSTERTAGAVRLVLPADPEMIATVTALCAAEAACCAQTRFRLDITAGQLSLTAEAPGAPGLLDALFPASAPGLQ
jgi:hypothetical protein